MVIYQGDNFAFDTIGGEYAQEEPVSLNMAKAPVSVSISIEKNRFVFEIEYRGICTMRKLSGIWLTIWKPLQRES